MRIRIDGDNLAARTLKGYLEKLGYAVTDIEPTFVVRLVETEFGDVTLDGVDSDLERRVIYHMEDLGIKKFVIQRAGGARLESQMLITYPVGSDPVVSRAVARAISMMETKKEAKIVTKVSFWKKIFPIASILALLATNGYSQQFIYGRAWDNVTLTGVDYGDSANSALRVNIVAGGAAGGGTSSSFGAAFPATGTASGFTDGTNMRGAKVFDLDTGGGTDYTLGVSLRLTSGGGSVEAGGQVTPLYVRTAATSTTSTITAISQGVTSSGITNTPSSWTVEISGTWTGTIEFQGKVSSATYYATQVVNDSTGALVTSTTANGVFKVPGGWETFRVFSTAWSSGTAGIDIYPGGVSNVFLSKSLPTGSNTIGAVTATNLDIRDLTHVSDSVEIGDGTDTALVSGSGSLQVTCDNCGGSTFADDDAFTGGTTSILPVGALYDTTPPSITDGSAGIPRMSSTRVLLVDGSGATQPVSGTFWQATQPISAASLPLPTGAATSANQLPDGHNVTVDNASIAITAASLPLPSGASTSALQDGIIKDGTGDTTQANVTTGRLNVDGSGVTQPVSGTFWQATQPVSGTFFQTTQPISIEQTGNNNAVDVLTLPAVTATDLDIRNLTSTDTVTAVQATGSNLHVVVDTAPSTVVTATDLDIHNLSSASDSVSVLQATASNLNATVVQATGTNLHTVVDSGTITTVTTVTNLTNLPNEGQQTAANSISVAPDTDNDAIGASGAAPPGEYVAIGANTSGADTTGLLGAITVCDSHAAIDIVTATTTLIVTGVANRHVRICSVNLVTAAANNVAIIAGTGATCGTSTAGVNGGVTAAEGWNFAANGGISQGSGFGEIMSTKVTGGATGDSVCIITSAATQLSGTIGYAIY